RPATADLLDDIEAFDDRHTTVLAQQDKDRILVGQDVHQRRAGGGSPYRNLRLHRQRIGVVDPDVAARKVADIDAVGLFIDDDAPRLRAGRRFGQDLDRIRLYLQQPVGVAGDHIERVGALMHRQPLDIAFGQRAAYGRRALDYDGRLADDGDVEIAA